MITEYLLAIADSKGVDVPSPAMISELHLPVAPIDQLAKQILATRQISRADQRCFMVAALSQNSLSGQDRILVDRLFEALKTGLLKVVD